MNCDVYWGSHGCCLPFDHEGPCECNCCTCIDHERDQEANGCVAKPPYYGPNTHFYGYDVGRRASRGQAGDNIQQPSGNTLPPENSVDYTEVTCRTTRLK